jgi:ribosomal protein S18 acetylase RimI-like enzyme
MAVDMEKRLASAMRLAGPADLPAVEELTRRAYAHYEAELGGEPVPLTENYAPRIAAGEVWLLEEARAPLGLIVLEEHPDRLHIFSVAVDPDRQHAGAGRKLLAFAEETARERGLGLLDLYTNAKMDQNIAIYRRCGFVETGRRPNPKRAGWIVVDMQKPLPAHSEIRRAV